MLLLIVHSYLEDGHRVVNRYLSTKGLTVHLRRRLNHEEKSEHQILKMPKQRDEKSNA